MMAVPAVDFQVHNTMFLVAHFHNTIIGGVVFGFLGGITYWFPKVFGFRLNETLGKASAYFWQVGFILAFMPLYALGLMGAVRRIDHYTDPSWQPFFIVSAIGVMVVGLGIGAFVLQLIVSIVQRKKLRDTTGDPWDGRTLEWSVPSPAPVYNFATIPTVYQRDDWWYKKQAKTPLSRHYEDIVLPKNSATGIWLGVAAGLLGFGAIWHIWWLLVASLIAIVLLILRRGFEDDTEYILPAKRVMQLEKEARA